MTGSQFQKTSRATSSSPRLKYTNNCKFKISENSQVLGSNHKKNAETQKPVNSKGSVTPARPGKRRHQAIVSPVTTRTESCSPKAKFRSISSPVAIPTASCVGPSTLSTPSPEKLFHSDNDLLGLGGTLAVPKVSAEPPSPSLLPNPPKHWVGEKNAQCLAMKQQCRAVTQSLMTHLTSSGILVSAQ